MYRIHCHRANVDHELGSDRVLSAHRTSDGVVAYLRCPCGDIVVAGPGAHAGRGQSAA